LQQEENLQWCKNLPRAAAAAAARGIRYTTLQRVKAAAGTSCICSGFFFAKGPLRSPAALLLHVMQIGDEMIFSLTHL
jgi:hypothetical protein